MYVGLWQWLNTSTPHSRQAPYLALKECPVRHNCILDQHIQQLSVSRQLLLSHLEACRVHGVGGHGWVGMDEDEGCSGEALSAIRTAQREAGRHAS